MNQYQLFWLLSVPVPCTTNFYYNLYIFKFYLINESIRQIRLVYFQKAQQTRDIEQMFVECRVSVADGGLT